ncbi:MAG: ATP-binding cassette domain-containing protein [Proteobacteria bacterium]|nr:ATP-binding cassette domain-containing protein [Pseudomonadota bacterium]
MIDVDNVTKRYHSLTAVDRVSFVARDSEVLALLGPNGAGKTSLVRMIMGITMPDDGRVNTVVDGRPAARCELGYLPEERGLHKGVPIARTLAFLGRLQGMSRTDAAQSSQAWLDRMGLGDRAKAKIEELSRGNQQKVQFVASILHRPRVAVLDEPFAGLDPVNQELFIELIGELRAQGTTVLLSAHQMSLVEKVADRVVLLGRGQVVLSGTLAEIQRQHGAGDVYTIALTREIDCSALENHPHVLALEHPNEREIRVVASSGQPLGDILVGIEVSAIASVRPDRVTLHDVYVEAVRQAEKAAA